MHKNLPAFIFLALMAWLAPAAAQNIYRCGDAYSQAPCPGGAAVQVEDARSAAQRTQSIQAVQRDAKAADAMEKARRKEEAKPVAAYVPPPKANGEAVPEKKKPALSKPKKPPYFTATAPKKPGQAEPKKKKAKKTSA